MADRTNLASTAAEEQAASSSFSPHCMQSGDKWQNFKWGLQYLKRSKNNWSILEIGVGGIMENMTCSLSSRAPRQERETDTEISSSLFFSELRDKREKQGMLGLQREWNLCQQRGFKRRCPGGGKAGPDMIVIRCLHFQFPIVLMWRSLSFIADDRVDIPSGVTRS